MSSTERPTKRQAFLALLRDGWTSLHIDTRRSGVIVPPNLRQDPHLVLQYGHDLPIPIPDLEVDDYGVRATLSFSRNAHLTVVPWAAVYVVACTDGRGVLYAEDVPDDVAIISARPQGDGVPADLDLALGCDDDVMLPPPRAARLRSIPFDAQTIDAQPAIEEPLVSRRKRRPQLRLVK